MSKQNPNRSPAFQFYADDFLAGTADMSAEEVGAYIRLLCHQWSKGAIPADEERAGRIAGLMGSPCLRYVLAKFSPCDDGQLRNARLEKVRQEQAEFRANQARSGKKGAEARWSQWRNDGNPIGDAMASPSRPQWRNDGSPSPSPSPTNTQYTPPASPSGSLFPETGSPKPKAKRELPPGFEAFWAAYPKRVSKPQAERAWAKLHPDEATQKRIIAHIQAQRATDQWIKDSGAFIPYPASYLNARRWEDFIEPLAPSRPKRLSEMTEAEKKEMLRHVMS